MMVGGLPQIAPSAGNGAKIVEQVGFTDPEIDLPEQDQTPL